MIISKLVGGRPRDLEDVRSILLKQTTIDDAYIREWLGRIVPEQASVLLNQFETLEAASRRLRREKKK